MLQTDFTVMAALLLQQCFIECTHRRFGSSKAQSTSSMWAASLTLP